METSLFDFSGMAALSDIRDEYWKSIMTFLEADQAALLKQQPHFRSREYIWPEDPLHTWSRLWEYPYVYHHLRKIKEKNPGQILKAVDFGSGVTFFPFSVAQLGYDVTCGDIDPLVVSDIPRAAQVVPHSPGQVSAVLIQNDVLPVESSSQDVVYCISVLEHIPQYEAAIQEIHRILKPGGRFILTFDIDLRGDYEFGVEQFYEAKRFLGQFFEMTFQERVIHPVDLLDSYNSPCHFDRGSSMRQFRHTLRKHILKKKYVGPLHLAVYAACYMRRS